MKSAFYERVLYELTETPVVNKSNIIGIDKSEMVQIRVLDWGTNRDGTPFGGGGLGYSSGAIAYMKKDVMAINVGDGKWLMDRGYILGLD